MIVSIFYPSSLIYFNKRITKVTLIKKTTPIPTLAASIVDPYPSQQHVGLQHSVLRSQQEVTRPKV